MEKNQHLFEILEDSTIKHVREVAERYNRIMENSNDGIIVFDPDFVIHYCNPPASIFLGATMNELKGGNLADFLNDEVFTNIQDLCDSSRVNETKICSTMGLDSRSTTTLHLDICIASEKGCRYGLTSLYMSDRTQLNKALNELSHRNAFFNNLIRSSTDGIIAADMNGRLIVFNKGAQDMTKYSEEEAFTSLHVSMLYPEGEAKRILRRMRSEEFGGEGKLMRHRLTGLAKDGTKIPLSLSGSIIYDENGKELATVGIFTDQRDIQKIEKQLEKKEYELIQSEKMASLGKLAAGVAHEINNPLTGILTFAEELIEEADPDDEKLEDYKIIHRETLRCREIVRDLLDFAKHDVMEMRPIDINIIVMQGFALVKRLASFRNIEITHSLAKYLPDVFGDPSQLNQVFLNLMVNASEAMPQGGELYIATKLVEDGQYVDVSFSDTGDGIPPEVLHKIFEPFFSTKGGKTNGLGLAVSWGIIEQHRGKIVVDTAKGQGTTFHVMLLAKRKEIKR